MSLTPRRWASAAAATVFVLGFGALATASALGLGDRSLPGLFTFRAATIGDGILLPLLAYALVRSAGPVRGWGRTTRRAVGAAAGVGALGGIALQAQWLAPPAPVVNWTFPAPGTFNAVGWYHAAFLVLASGFFAGACAAAVSRLRQGAPPEGLGPAGVLGALVPALTFTALLAEDNSTGGSTLTTTSVMVAGSAIAAACVLVWATRRTAVLPCLLACAAAALPAMATALLFLPGRTNSLVTVLPVVCAALVGAFGASVLGPRTSGGRIAVAVCSALCAAGPVQAVSGLPATTIPLLSTGCAVSIFAVAVQVLLLRALFGLTGEKVVPVLLKTLAGAPVIAFGLSGRYFAQEQELVGAYSVVVGVAAALLFLRIPALVIRLTFDRVVEAETTNAAATELTALKWNAYLAISTMYSAALLSFLASVVGTTSEDRWVAGRNEFGPLVVPVITLVLLVAVGVATGSRPVPAPRSTTSAGCLLWSGLMAYQLTDGYGDWKQATLSTSLAVLSGLFVLEGVVGNAGHLSNVPVDSGLLGTAVSCALAFGTTAAWMTGPALWSASGATSLPVALTSLAVGVSACVLLPRFAVAAAVTGHPPRKYILGTPVGNMVQDCSMAVMLTVSVAWVPILFMAHLSDGASWWSAIPPFLALLSAAYVYILKTNIGHVERERVRITELAAPDGAPLPADADQVLKALARHVRRQNWIAFAALVPFSFFALFNEITGFDKSGLGQILKV